MASIAAVEPSGNFLEIIDLVNSVGLDRAIEALRGLASGTVTKVKPRAKRTKAKARILGFSRVTYRKTKCGWLEPNIKLPSSGAPRIKDMAEYQARLMKGGCDPIGNDGEYTLYRTPEGSVLKVRVTG